MRVVCCICNKPAKARCNGKNGGCVWEGPLCAAHYERLRRHGTPLGFAPKGPNKGKIYRTPLEKRYEKGDGYIRLFDPSHPNSNKAGYLSEHTYIMSCHLERPLFPDESVHHLNGIRHDNRIENLELWTKPPRKGIRVKDAILDCIEFLKLYGIRTCE